MRKILHLRAIGVPDTPMIGINRGRTDRSVWQLEGLRMNAGTYSVRILDATDNLWSFLSPPGSKETQLQILLRQVTGILEREG